MPMTWDSTAEASLFKCFLKVHNISPRHADIAKEMQALGYNCSTSAVMHRFHDMKKAGKSNPTGSLAATTLNDDDTAPTTPVKKPKTRTPSAKTPTTPRANKRKLNKVEEDVTGTVDANNEEADKSSPKIKKAKTDSEDEGGLTVIKEEV